MVPWLSALAANFHVINLAALCKPGFARGVPRSKDSGHGLRAPLSHLYSSPPFHITSHHPIAKIYFPRRRYERWIRRSANTSTVRITGITWAGVPIFRERALLRKQSPSRSVRIFRALSHSVPPSHTLTYITLHYITYVHTNRPTDRSSRSLPQTGIDSEVGLIYLSEKRACCFPDSC